MKTVLTSVITTLLVLLCFFHPLFIFLVAYLGIGFALERSDKRRFGEVDNSLIRLVIYYVFWPIYFMLFPVLNSSDRDILYDIIPGYTMTFHKPITFTKNDSV